MDDDVEYKLEFFGLRICGCFANYEDCCMRAVGMRIL